MPITIKGIRITSVVVTREEDGSDKINCEYQLLSSEDKVLARQSLSTKQSYGETVFVPPSDVLKKISDGVTAYRAAIETHLGIT